MAFPADNTRVNKTGSFGYRAPFRLPNGQMTRTLHGGVDIAPEVKGTKLPVYAVGRGTIHSVGQVREAGIYIILRDSANTLWRYCHLSSVRVRPGQVVQDAEHIGEMGTTGNSTGVHLHLEKYPNGQLNTRVDPWPAINPERNPVTYAINGGKGTGSKPAPKPTPAPTPAPSGPEVGPGGITSGQFLLLKGGWRGYGKSNLTEPQSVLLPTGTYQVWDIDNGSFRVSGAGRDAWVHGVKASKGNPVSGPATPAPTPKPAPKPAPKPTPAKPTLRVGAKVKLSSAWVRYKYSDLRTTMTPRTLAAGTYTVKSVASNGAILLSGNGAEGWVHSSAKSGVVG